MTRLPPRRAAPWLAFLAAACVESGHHPRPGEAEREITAPALARTAAPPFELWVVDQSNTDGLAYGGTLHVFDGTDLMGASAASARPIARLDLGGATAALCQAQTGALPVRPHMLFFGPGHTHAVLSFVASGHVVVFDARTRQPVACLRASPGAGGARQAHAAVPSPDGSYILVANQNGKLLERIDSDYGANVFTLVPAATIDLANCTTPNGQPCQAPATRPDNAPICGPIDGTSRLAWITLRGGGLLVVDPKATPMRIVGEYDRQAIHGNGCGGVAAAGHMYLNAGGATAANLSEFDVYQLPLSGYAAANPPNTPAARHVFSADHLPDRDAHGVLATRDERYLWMFDRAANLVEIFESATGAHLSTLPLVTPQSPDLTPDLVDIAPAGNRIFVSLRGPVPLSGDPHASTGSTPGVAVVQVEQGGRTGVVKSVVRISNRDAAGVERADPHGLRVRVP